MSGRPPAPGGRSGDHPAGAAAARSGPLSPPAADEGITSPRVLARLFLQLRRRARAVREGLGARGREQRLEARALLKRLFDLERLLEIGFASEQQLLLMVRDARILEDQLDVLLGEPRAIDLLDPELLLRRPWLGSRIVEYRPPAVRNVRWPIRVDLHRFEVLGRQVFATYDEFKRKEARTESCIAKMRTDQLTPSHDRRERDVDKHMGVLAVRQRKLPPAS
ncbi:MAG: hypothetical protein RBU45_01400 [Myxococcota bacterium]|nr:hypothetical protein [Myxococcota bacterium]